MKTTIAILLIVLPFACFAEDGYVSECPPGARLQESKVLIGWLTDDRQTTQFGSNGESSTTVVGPFRPVAVLAGSSLAETDGASLKPGVRYWPVSSPKSKPVVLTAVGSFFDRMGEDHCVYYADIKGDRFPKWTLFSSRPLPETFRAPTEQEKKKFFALNTSCVVQGDYPEGKSPPCVRPKLLAVSDIDGNGVMEYWATQPYMWDTGLTVWVSGEKLTPILQVCIGCSD